MCGILGVTFKRNDRFEFDEFENLVRKLYLLSETRGKESAGIAAASENRIDVIKRPIPASKFVRTSDYKSLIDSLRTDDAEVFSLIGHSRLVTNGSQENHENNQPIHVGGVVGVHNGIVVNHADLYDRFPDISRSSDVDSEVIFSLIRRELTGGKSLGTAASEVFGLIEGQASIAALFRDLDSLLLYTNHGSLFLAGNRAAGLFMFASERKILAKALESCGLDSHEETVHPKKIMPGGGVILRLTDLSIVEIGYNEPDETSEMDVRKKAREVNDWMPDERQRRQGVMEAKSVSSATMREFEDHFTQCQEASGSLRRCEKCILPSTMPHIRFDEDGVCNYCHNYITTQPKPMAELGEILKPHRRTDGEPEVLLGLSGGRDSCYALHVAKKELGLNPVAFTYDWGMVTDLARRNVSRMCGKLGIEHILVSANLRRKRDNVRRNILAWLKRPDLGLIPLFMAGDKQYFYYAQKIRKELGLKLSILGENLLERTDFKFGFCGVSPGSKDSDRAWVLTGGGQLRMVSHYASNFLMNPGYWNRSIPDTIWAYTCNYLIPRDYVNLYRYVQWDENRLESTLFGEYDWELSPDTTTSWRIGDGTAAFYNYIYYAIAGFSEQDTIRSNQIREGVISREEALERARKENFPRWPSIQGYCDTIDIDFESAIRSINSVPKLYPWR